MKMRRWCVMLLFVIGPAAVESPPVIAATPTLASAADLSGSGPSATLSVSSASASVIVGRGVRFTTRVQPARPRRKVTFQRKVGQAWRAIGTRTTSAGAARLTFRPARIGSVTVRAVVAKSGKHRRLVTRTRTIRVLPAPTTSIFPLTPDPLNVTYTVDLSRRIQRIVVADTGGTVKATAADGTAYRLAVPADTLLADTEITMTPVTAVAGSGLTDFGAAVEIRPHGLLLLEPATLTITPPTDQSLTTHRAFVFDEDGRGAGRAAAAGRPPR